ncbi:MAG: SMP-30/gluconolactonase/LRE family protein [Pseudomonadota bacterium]|nr:SMP-30/gluconolactonase/LRE family protein [Pseudomonadota bacterium]
MSAAEPVCVWAVGAELGEGPLWDAATRSVYFVDIKGRQVHRYGEQGERRSWPAPQQVGFIVPLAAGGFACGLQDGLYRFCQASGDFTLLRHVEQELPSNRFNDGFVDAEGCLWFGSMDDAERRPSGALYRLSRDGQLSIADRDYVITNGPAMSPDGRTLYHTDTLEKTVFRFDVLADGSLGGKRPFARIAGSGHPDGMAVDAEGCVWIALFGGGRIERYAACGDYLGSVAFPCSNVTKLAFGGADLRTVYATTAWKGLTAAQRAREPLAGALFSFRTAAPGLAPHPLSAGASA